MSRLDLCITRLERDGIRIRGVRIEEAYRYQKKGPSQNGIRHYTIDWVIQQCVSTLLRQNPGANEEHRSDRELAYPGQPDSHP